MRGFITWVLLLGACVDGSTTEKSFAIQNGVATDRANVAALRYTGTFQGTPVDKVGCSATLIAPDVLITAAHCIDPAITDMVGLPRVGFAADAASSTWLDADRVVVHENFVYTTPFHIYLESPHDIGLVFLAAPASPTPATISRDAPVAAANLDLVGYGQRVVGDDGTLGLEHVAAMAISEVGVTEIREVGTGSPMACVAEGDSGGPAFAGERVVGITSHSGGETFDCIHGDISERVDVYVDWIIEHAPDVCAHSDVCDDPDPPADDGGCRTTRGVSAWWALALVGVMISRRKRAAATR